MDGQNCHLRSMTKPILNSSQMEMTEIRTLWTACSIYRQKGKPTKSYGGGIKCLNVHIFPIFGIFIYRQIAMGVKKGIQKCIFFG